MTGRRFQNSGFTASVQRSHQYMFRTFGGALMVSVRAGGSTSLNSFAGAAGNGPLR